MTEEVKQRCETLIEKSKIVVREAFEKFDPKNLGITWTGGKDSTTSLWIIRQVCLEDNVDLPVVMTIDEGDAFPEITDFLVQISNKWNIDLKWRTNWDVLARAHSHLGNTVQVKDLNERNKAELERIELKDDSFNFEAESEAGNHLMKTVVFNQFVEEYNLKGMFVGIRRDEQATRKNDEYFTDKESGHLVPSHTRICPILDFTERDIWNNTKQYNIPFCSLYGIGYRSLGARTSTNISEYGVPAWEQDLEHTSERGARRQDKEKAMERLRKLGYM